MSTCLDLSCKKMTVLLEYADIHVIMIPNESDVGLVARWESCQVTRQLGHNLGVVVLGMDLFAHLTELNLLSI